MKLKKGLSQNNFAQNYFWLRVVAFVLFFSFVIQPVKAVQNKTEFIAGGSTSLACIIGCWYCHKQCKKLRNYEQADKPEIKKKIRKYKIFRSIFAAGMLASMAYCLYQLNNSSDELPIGTGEVDDQLELEDDDLGDVVGSDDDLRQRRQEELQKRQQAMLRLAVHKLIPEMRFMDPESDNYRTHVDGKINSEWRLLTREHSGLARGQDANLLQNFRKEIMSMAQALYYFGRSDDARLFNIDAVARELSGVTREGVEQCNNIVQEWLVRTVATKIESIPDQTRREEVKRRFLDKVQE